MKKLITLLLVLTGAVCTASAWGDMYLICKENDNWNVDAYGSAFQFVKVDDTHYRATVPGSYINNGNWNFRFREKNGSWWNIGPIGSQESDNTEVNETAVSTNYQNSNQASFYVKQDAAASFVQILIEWADPYWKVTSNVISDTYNVYYANPDGWETVRAYAYYDVDNCATQYPLGEWNSTEALSLDALNNLYSVSVPAIAGGKIIFMNGERSNQHPNGAGFDIAEDGIYGSEGKVDAYTVTIGDASYATFSSIYPLDFTGITTVKAYRAESAATGKVNMTQVTGKVPALTGLFLAGATTEIPTTICTTSIGDNLLKPTTGGDIYNAEKTQYVFAKQDEDYGFYKVGGSLSPDAGKAYLETTSEVSGARLVLAFDEDITAVEGVKAVSAQENVYYNLAGQRVAQPVKGLYIVNGKKVIMK